MEYLNIKTINLIKRSDKLNYTFKVKPDSIDINQANDNLLKYKIIIKSFKPQFVQFKINCKFIKKINFEYNNIKYSQSDIPYEGVLTNCYLDLEKDFIISPEITEECGQVNLFDISIVLNPDTKLKKLEWDKIFIINLERRTDRKDQMIKMLNKFCIENYEFVEALDGKDIEISNEFEKIKNSKKTKIVNTGHYGCLLSHIKALELAQKQNLKSVLILEDDVILDEDYYKLINITKIPNNYDMIYLGGIIPQIKFFPIGWAKGDEIMGTYAYLVPSHMYSNILKILHEQIFCADITYIEYIQNKYQVYIVDDIVKTNLDSSDTSNKNKILFKLLDRTYNKPIKI